MSTRAHLLMQSERSRRIGWRGGLRPKLSSLPITIFSSRCSGCPFSTARSLLICPYAITPQHALIASLVRCNHHSNDNTDNTHTHTHTHTQVRKYTLDPSGGGEDTVGAGWTAVQPLISTSDEEMETESQRHETLHHEYNCRKLQHWELPIPARFR